MDPVVSSQKKYPFAVLQISVSPALVDVNLEVDKTRVNLENIVSILYKTLLLNKNMENLNKLLKIIFAFIVLTPIYTVLDNFPLFQAGTFSLESLNLFYFQGLYRIIAEEIFDNNLWMLAKVQLILFI